MNWPIIRNISSLEDAKTFFRLANTQFKKALNFYVLEGFVTENVTIKQAISLCYRYLTKIEPDSGRNENMQLKRIEMLEHLQKELNPNTY